MERSQKLGKPEITGFGESLIDSIPPLPVAEFARIRGKPELLRVRLRMDFLRDLDGELSLKLGSRLYANVVQSIAYLPLS